MLRNTRIAANHQKLGQGKEGFSPTGFRENMVLLIIEFWTFSLRYKTINFCCLKPLSCGFFIMATLGNSYTMATLGNSYTKHLEPVCPLLKMCGGKRCGSLKRGSTMTYQHFVGSLLRDVYSPILNLIWFCINSSISVSCA